METQYEVGQALYFVGTRRYNKEPRFVYIQKVGRKWLQLDNGNRVDIETLTADGAGFVSPGQAYLNQEVYKARVKLQNAWDAVRRRVDDARYVPPDMTVERISEALTLLGLA